MHDLRSIASRHRKSLLVSFVVLLLLRSRLYKLPQDVIRKLNSGSHPKLTPEELAQVLQQVYVDEKDGSKTLLVPYRDGVSKVRQSVLGPPDGVLIPCIPLSGST